MPPSPSTNQPDTIWRDAVKHYSRGNAHYFKGNLDRAIAEYDKAISLDPKNGNAYYRRGNVYQDKGNFNRAIADYDTFTAAQLSYAVDCELPDFG